MILALWKPNDDIPIFYVIAFCWALAECIWETLALSKKISDKFELCQKFYFLHQSLFDTFETLVLYEI
jgi:hypothetical protein